MVLTDGDFAVRVVQLPYRIRGMTCVDEDDFANIYINEHLSDEAKERAIEHELRHLMDSDHYSCSTIEAIECD